MSKEYSAYSNIKRYLGNDAFVKPRGSDPGFPDFGFFVNGIDCHFEHKDSWNAQMSGLSSFEFSGGSFRTNVRTDDASFIIRLMNRNLDMKRNANFVIDVVKKMLNRKIGIKLSSLILGDKKRSLVAEFDKKMEGRKVLGKASSPLNASSIINIYKNKFADNMRSGVKKHICFMYIGDEIWVLDSVGVSKEEIMSIVRMMNPKAKSINKFALRDCYLEARISPRSSGRIDTRALLNLQSYRSIIYKGVTV